MPDSLLLEQISKFEEYWKRVRGREPNMAEREAYFMGRIHQIDDRPLPKPLPKWCKRFCWYCLRNLQIEDHICYCPARRKSA